MYEYVSGHNKGKNLINTSNLYQTIYKWIWEKGPLRAEAEF